MILRRKFARIGVLLALGAGLAVGLAQFQRDRDRDRGDRGPFGGGGFERYGGSQIRGEGGTFIDEDTVRTARETESHSMETPKWTNAPGFQKDVFTFARVIFKTAPDPRRSVGRGFRLGWWVDFPDADLNISYRLQQLTSMKVDPDCRVLRLTDRDLPSYPFIFMEHPGYMKLDDEEVEILRKYLLNGGALLVIDFWSEREWEGFEAEMKRVLPGRSWVDLPMTHPIFNCVFTLKGSLRDVQVPTIQFWNPDHNPKDAESPIHRVDRGEGSHDMHVRAWLDDKQRIMAIVLHNSDVSDGWEREGENDDYFKRYSEKIAYPLGINLIVYLMTH